MWVNRHCSTEYVDQQKLLFTTLLALHEIGSIDELFGATRSSCSSTQVGLQNSTYCRLCASALLLEKSANTSCIFLDSLSNLGLETVKKNLETPGAMQMCSLELHGATISL